MIDPEEATEIIEEFHAEFGPAHLQLAYHAAFPLILNPDLLYHIWANFQWDLLGNHLDIPWYAVADVLLSPLCREVAYETYAMDELVRDQLLAALAAEPRFQQGERSRLRELGMFLERYVTNDSNHPRASIREQAEAQRWTALAFLQPATLTAELKAAYTKVAGPRSRAQHLRLANLLQTFDLSLANWAKPDAATAQQFQALVDYGLGWKQHYQGKPAAASTHFQRYTTLAAGDATLTLPPAVESVPEFDPDPDLLYFNGINGDTGDYDLAPMRAEQLFDLLRSVAEPENLKELKYRVQWETEEHLGVVGGIDPTKVAEAGWGVIFPADPEGTFVPAVKEALKPLLDLRREQAGEHFRIYEGVDALRPGESKSDFLVRHGVPPADPANPERMPYYLLLVGDPSQISYRFQSQLDVQYAVGRIFFETIQEYANYAASVFAAETGRVSVPKKAAFFGAMNRDDPLTTRCITKFMEPLLGQMPRYGSDWQITAHLRETATKAQLTQLLGRGETPALLFTAGHGMTFTPGNPRQVAHQGALLCQDWPGPRRWSGRAIPSAFYFSGDDLAHDANLLGMIALFFAGYSGGISQHDEFPRPGSTDPNQVAPSLFMANLPMRMLGREKGGALAVIAQIERVWSSAFIWSREIEYADVFQSTLMHLMAGKPVGSALEYFNSRYATWASELSTTLRDVQFGLQVEPMNIANLWTAMNDVRGFAIIGDPAVRLPLADSADATPVRPEIHVARNNAGRRQGEARAAAVDPVDDFLWLTQARTTFDVTGGGLRVAIIDTGINSTHVDFQGRITTQVNFTTANRGNANDAGDDNGVGTTLAGIIAAAGIHTGIAPGAHLIPLKVTDSRGTGNFQVIEQALQWVIDHHTQHNITAVCLTLGDNGNYTRDDEHSFSEQQQTIRQQIQRLTERRVAVITPTGNEYFHHRSRQGMAFPAIVRESVSVGAIYATHGDGFEARGAKAYRTSPGQITPYSQRLHRSVNGDCYTDIFAPGGPMPTAGIGSPTASVTRQGTNQAAAMVAGVILLMQEYYQRQRQTWPTTAQLDTWLQTGSLPIYDGDTDADNVGHTNLVFTRVDAFSAINAVRQQLQQDRYELERQSTIHLADEATDRTTATDHRDVADPQAPARSSAQINAGEESLQAYSDEEADALSIIAQARSAFDVTGAGLTVALLDTGLNSAHVDFAGRVLAQVNFTTDNNSDPNNANDGNGHGTNIGGILLAAGDHMGVAPQAMIVPLKVLTNHGGGDFTAVDQALTWVVENHEQYNITAVCIGLGDGGNYTSDQFTDPTGLHNRIRQKIQRLATARVAVVAPAGNDFFRYNSEQGMSFPAIVRDCISVGAHYLTTIGSVTYGSGAKATTTRAGQITPFSQRLHSSVNPDTATTIFAPGAPITSAGINGTHGESTQHGTTQAAAVVAGLILLLQELYRRSRDELPTIEQLVTWLQTGVPVFDGDFAADNVQHTNLTFTRVDALSALDAARRAIHVIQVEPSK